MCKKNEMLMDLINQVLIVVDEYEVSWKLSLVYPHPQIDVWLAQQWYSNNNW